MNLEILKLITNRLKLASGLHIQGTLKYNYLAILYIFDGEQKSMESLRHGQELSMMMGQAFHSPLLQPALFKVTK